MKTSEQINELAKALAEAQGEMKSAAKDAKNPFFNSSYATLDSIWEACRESLSKHGLSVIQAPVTDEFGLRLVTRLCHESGQWIEGTLTIRPSKDDLQGIGSAITYGRRYMLGAMVGVATDNDDDGNEAATKVTGKQQKPNGNGKTARPFDANQLLGQLNRVKGLKDYYKDTTELLTSIRSIEQNEAWEWPNSNNIEAWRSLFVKVRDHIFEILEMNQDQGQPEAA